MPSNNTDELFASYDLLIGDWGESGYPITLTDSPAGNASGQLDIDPFGLELVDAVDAFAERDTDAAFLREFGGYLFRHLFNDKIKDQYRASLAIARTRQQILAVRLHIEPAELRALPWEYLFDEEEDVFLAISPETPLFRFVPQQIPRRSKPISLPFRLLVVISNPDDAAALDSKREIADIKFALDETMQHGAVELTILEDGKITPIIDAIERVQPHIVHFIGHGMFDDEHGYLLLEDESGHALPVNDSTVREIFTSARTVRLVLLNACESGSLSSYSAIVGMAPRLLQRRVSAVIAMQLPIQDRAAIVFTRRFYAALSNGVALESAVTSARREIFLKIGADEPGWGAPVLFMRSNSGRLIQVQRGAESAVMSIPPPPKPEKPPVNSGFVGRKQELAHYRAQLMESDLAVIAGMPGVGKTSLAVQLANQVSTPQMTFWHTFKSGEGLDTLIWKFAGFLYWNDQQQLWQMLQGVQQGNGILPPLEVLFDYAMQMISGKRYLICLENLSQLMDDPALQSILKKLLTARQSGELVIIVTARRIPAFVSMTKFAPLRGLTRTDVDDLLAARQFHLPKESADTLTNLTEGNAELLTIALSTLARASAPAQLIARLTDTRDVERFLLDELDESLTEIERSIEIAVALLGQPSIRDAIECMLQTGNLRRELHELSERFLLTIHDDDWVLNYDHHTILRAFYADHLSLQQRRELHLRVATYYEHDAQNWLASIRHYIAAEEYAPASRLATEHLRTIINTGHAGQLRRLLDKILATQIGTELRVDAYLACGQLDDLLGDFSSAQNHFDTANDRLNSLPDSLANQVRRVQVCLGMGRLLQHRAPESALEWLQRGVDAVLSAEADETEMAVRKQQLATLYVYIGGVQEALGNYGDAQRIIDQALALLADSSSEIRATALLHLGNVHSLRGQYDAAKEATQAALAISQQFHDHFLTLKLLKNLGIDAETAGDWTGALSNYEEALALAQQLGGVVEQSTIWNSIGVLQTKRGEDAQAQAALTESIDMARQHHLAEDLLYALSSLVELLVQTEDYGPLEPILVEATALAADTNIKYPLPAIYCGWARLYLARQQHVDALANAAHAVDLARELGVHDQEGVALRVLGEVQAATNQLEAARQSFVESLILLDGRDLYEAARTKVSWTMYADNGDSDGVALRRLCEAKAIFEELGAQRDLANLQVDCIEL